MDDIAKAKTYLRGISERDATLATEHLHPTRYLEHNPDAGDGAVRVRGYVDTISGSDPYLKVIRAYQDGPLVVTQADGNIDGEHRTLFDVWRFDEGQIVEHWAFFAKAGPPNKSGHTQVDGQVEARADVDGQASKKLVQDYYEAVHIGGHHDQIPHFISDGMPRHEPGVADGRQAFEQDLKVLTRDRTIDEIALMVAEGDMVFLVAKGTHAGEPAVYVDLYRVEGDKLVEHWGFPQPVPPASRRKNGNGMV